MSDLLRDARHAFRTFARRPGTTLTMIAVLAIGMTVAATLFSFLRSFSVEPAPGIERADDLVRIRGARATPWGLQARLFTPEELEAQRASTAFTAVAGWTETSVAVERAGAEDPDWVDALFVTDGYFDVLGVRPVAGAGLAARGPGESPLVAVVSRALRERHFASDAAALGATLVVAGKPVTVVGVAPARFRGADIGAPHTLWIPDAARPVLAPAHEPRFGAAARLAPGVDLASASAAMNALAVHTAPVSDTARDDTRQAVSTDVLRMTALSGDPGFEAEMRNMTAGFALLGFLVLVVTGTNASALQTGLATTRGREIAMRLSLGASRSRIVRQLLTESGVLGLLAGALALALLLTAQWLVPFALPDMPLTPRLDATSVAFTFAVALAAGVVAGLSPALFASRAGVAAALKATTGGTSAHRGALQRGLVVVQVMLTLPLVVMLTAMVLVVVDEWRRQAIQDVAHEVATLRLQVASADAGAVDPTLETERLLRELGTLPGVARAVASPRWWPQEYEDYAPAGATPDAGRIGLEAQFIAPGWFDVMDVALRAGRGFADTDRAGPDAPPGQERPVVVGEDLAAALWPGQNPIGRRLAPPADAKDPPFVVVGVAATRPETARRAGQPYAVYLPAPAKSRDIALLLRLRGDATAALREVRRVLRETAPGLGVVELRTLAAVEAEARGAYLMGTAALAGLGLLALFIAAIGLYAVVAFAVAQRVAEIAVRLAVGARTGQVVRQTMGDGLRLTGIGLGVGLPLGLAGLAAALATPGFMPSVPLWQVAAIAFLAVAAIATLATWLPARRAAKVEPARVLRSE